MNEELNFDELAPWLVILITLVGGGLRVLLLGSKGMWLDETFSVWLANHGVGEMLQWIIKIDQHPPLYYLLLRAWIGFKGDTAYDVRLLSALFGTLTIPIIYLTGKRMSSSVMGMAAAILLALSPFNIRFAQETRMYTLLAFNAAAAIYPLARLLTDERSTRPLGSQFKEYTLAWRTPKPVEPDRSDNLTYPEKETINRSGLKGWIARHHWLPIRAIETDLAWMAFILFSVATMLSHNTAVLFPLATNLFVFGLVLYQRKKKPGSPSTFRAPSLRNWLGAQAAIFLLWSPWLLPFIQQASRVYQEFWIPTPGWDTVLQALKSFLNESIAGQPQQVQVIWLLYALLLVLGLLHYRKDTGRFLFLAGLVAVPFLGELVVSAWRPIFYDKTLIWTTVPLLLLLAAGVAQLRFRFLIVLVVGILGINNLFSTSDYFRFLQKEDWSTPAGYVANFAQENDLVLFNANWVQIPFDYYFQSYEKQYQIEVVKHGIPEDMFASGVLEPKMTKSDIPELLSLINGQERVWLVYSHNWYTDPQGLIPQTLASRLSLIQQRYFYGGQVQLYAIP